MLFVQIHAKFVIVLPLGQHFIRIGNHNILFFMRSSQ